MVLIGKSGAKTMPVAGEPRQMAVDASAAVFLTARLRNNPSLQKIGATEQTRAESVDGRWRRARPPAADAGRYFGHDRPATASGAAA